MATVNGTPSRKRSREDFQNQYPQFVLAARKKFHLDQPETSASESHENHVIYFEPFLSSPIVLDDEVKIYPSDWARAFMQRDIRGIAEVLSCAIFTDDDIKKRNARGVADGLSTVKRLAIFRASKWMMNKQQNPWSFVPTEWVTPEEQNVIETVFQTIKSTKNYADTYQTPSDSELMEYLKDIDSKVSSTTPPEQAMDSNQIRDTQMQSQESQRLSQEFENIYENILENFNYTKVFMKVGELGWFGNSAQAARELTKITIRTNTDVFVDAVQFSKGRWAKAIMQRDIVLMAEVLFRKYWKTECNSTAASSLEDLCPVRRLAILRAVAWMNTKGKDRSTQPYDFDSAIPEHNSYPSPDEVDRIESEVFKKYLGISSGVINTGIPNQVPEHQNAVCNDNPANVVIFNQNECIVLDGSQTFHNLQAFEIQTNSGSTILDDSGNYDRDSDSVASLDQASNVSSDSASTSVGCSHNMDRLYPKVESSNVVINGFKIAQNIWDEAFRNFRDQKADAPFQAGKLLFENSFDEDEIKNHNFSGRNNKIKLCRIKINGILDSLSIMEAMNKSGLPTFGLQGQEIVVQKRTKEELQYLNKKIFTEHRNYLAKRLD